MANICNVNFRIVGTKENVDLMIEALEQKKDIYVGRGMYIEMPPDFEDLGDGKVACEGFAETKWSIMSSLIDNAVRMRENPEHWYFGEGINPNDIIFITLDEASEKYSVDIEMYSTECGCCFAEHYLIKHGYVDIEDCVPYFEIINRSEVTPELLSEMNRQLGREVTEEELDGGVVGGYGEYEWEI